MALGKIELNRNTVSRSPQRMPTPQLTKLPQLTGHANVACPPLSTSRKRKFSIRNDSVAATPSPANTVKPVTTIAAVRTPVTGNRKRGRCRPTKTPLATLPPPVVASNGAVAPACTIAAPPLPIVAAAPLVTSKTATCSLCIRDFANVSSLQKHVPVHSPLNRPFKCTECIEHYFGNKSSLTRHKNEKHVTKATVVSAVVAVDRRPVQNHETSNAVIKPMQHSQAVVTQTVTNASKLQEKPNPPSTSSSKFKLVTTPSQSAKKSKHQQQSLSKQNTPESSRVLAKKSTNVTSSTVPPTKFVSVIPLQIASMSLPKVESEPTISKNSLYLARNNKTGQKTTLVRKYANFKEAVTHFMELVDGYQLDEAEHVANTLKPVDSGDLLIVQNMHQLCKAVETIVSKKHDVPLDVLLFAHTHAIECIGKIVPQAEHKTCRLRKGLISRAIRFTIQYHFNREAFELCRMAKHESETAGEKQTFANYQHAIANAEQERIRRKQMEGIEVITLE